MSRNPVKGSSYPYVIDTSSLIDAKERYYGFDFCPGFWKFMKREIIDGKVIVLEDVFKEINAGTDELSKWLTDFRKKRDCFDCRKDQRVLGEYNEVAAYVRSYYEKFAIPAFLNPGVADPWLVAYSRVHGGTIVTHEVAREQTTARVSLVDVCDHYAIPNMEVYRFLRAEKAVLYSA